MKSYKDFIVINEAKDPTISKLVSLLVDTQKSLNKIADLANSIDTLSYPSNPARAKLGAVLRMCDSPDDIAKNGALMKQRIEQYVKELESAKA